MSTRKIWASLAGIALAGAGLAGPAVPAAAAPAGTGGGGTGWQDPVPGTTAEIEFSDAVTPARAAALSPHLSEIMRQAEQVRTVEIQAGALDRALTAESVAIELFDDVRIALDTNVAVSPGARSSKVYSAGGEDGAAIVTLIDGDVHGSIWRGSTKYGIEPLGGGRHLIFEDGRVFAPEAEPDDVGHGATQGGPATGGAGTLAVPVIDVMVAYDDAAVAQFGSVAATEAEAVEAINTSNMTYVNSQIDQELALTNILDLNYLPNATDGTDDYQTYLSAIRSKTDGIVDGAHTARDANGADLVAVLSDLTGACGVAYLPSSSDPAELNAYSLTDGSCAVGNLSFPHELGHNMCAHHDPDNAGTNPCEPDGFGHFSSADALRTVMAYPNPCGGCTRIPYFSNPDVAVSGWTTGILGERDNARVMEVMDDSIAAYRGSGPAPDACEVGYTITGTWPGNVQVDLVVENTTASAISGWTAGWTFTGDESVYNSWGVNVSQTGPDATATGDGFGATIPAGGTVTVGFQATVTGTPTVPAPISCST